MLLNLKSLQNMHYAWIYSPKSQNFVPIGELVCKFVGENQNLTERERERERERESERERENGEIERK